MPTAPGIPAPRNADGNIIPPYCREQIFICQSESEGPKRRGEVMPRPGSKYTAKYLVLVLDAEFVVASGDLKGDGLEIRVRWDSDEFDWESWRLLSGTCFLEACFE